MAAAIWKPAAEKPRESPPAPANRSKPTCRPHKVCADPSLTRRRSSSLISIATIGRSSVGTAARSLLWCVRRFELVNAPQRPAWSSWRGGVPTRSNRIEKHSHASCTSSWITVDFVLPEFYDLPAHPFQLGVNQAVPLPVRVKLVAPESRSVLRGGIMVWTTVPKTPMNEHRDLRCCENDIWPSW